jgi:4'-phosphopantetheinyl transferase
MKTQQETFYIDSNGQISNGFIASDGIAIDVANFKNFSSDRKHRRSSQSLATKELLNGSLKKHFKQNLADAWLLNKSETGKPFLSGKEAPLITMSHSGDWCACAISASFSVGIDVEVIKSRDWESYCNFAFHPKEVEWILEVTGRERDIRGLICWCRKEAVVKASGIGLLEFLSKIAFSPEGELIALPKELGEALAWKSFTKVHSDSLIVAMAWKIDLN